jgi:hypothetical protein
MELHSAAQATGIRPAFGLLLPPAGPSDNITSCDAGVHASLALSVDHVA